MCVVFVVCEVLGFSGTASVMSKPGPTIENRGKVAESRFELLPGTSSFVHYSRRGRNTENLQPQCSCLRLVQISACLLFKPWLWTRCRFDAGSIQLQTMVPPLQFHRLLAFFTRTGPTMLPTDSSEETPRCVRKSGKLATKGEE